MALEIERRFLVCAEGWRDHVRWQAELCQGYLVDAGPGLTLRVRLSERADRPPEAWLTIKAPPPETAQLAAETGGVADAAEAGAAEAGGTRPRALSRLEYEYPIPLADARGLLALGGQRVSKRRHALDLAGGDWVVDVFAEANAPLVVAEVELGSPEDPLVIPPWCGREITGRHELSNAALARHPLASWSDDERQRLLAP